MTIFDWRAHLKIHPAAELFPLLSQAELKELADDIQKNGLQTTIVIDAEGRLLDGRNRLDGLALLGLLEPGGAPTGLRIKGGDRDHLCAFTNTGDPFEVVLSLNVHRRHLTAEQKRDLIAKVLKAKPEQSNRAIAKQVKVDHKTVADVRTKAESTGEIPQLGKTVGADGRARKKKPARKADPREAGLYKRAEALGIELFRKGGDYRVRRKDGRSESIGEIAGAIEYLLLVETHGRAQPKSDVVKIAPLPTPPQESVKIARSSVNPRDIALEDFDAHVLGLLRLMKGQKPQRFAKTAVASPLLGDLAHFLREVVAVRKLATEPDDAAGSAERRKAEYAASEATP